MYVSIIVVCVVILALCISEIIAQSCIDTYISSDHDGQPFTKCGSSKQVGRINPLIINGIRADLGSFPWHAGVYYRTNGGGSGVESWEQACGGSLITDQFVLTAAHCVIDRQESDVRVALGKYYRAWDKEECSQQKRNVSKLIYPQEFHRQTYYFDIALLLLDEKIKLGELVMPVCTGLQGGPDYLLNKKLFVSGWGQTQNVNGGSSSETLLYKDVMFLPKRDCQRFIAPWFALFDKFCAKTNDSEESFVQPGDSGGGLTVSNEGLHHILGIVSVKYTRVEYQMSLLTNVTWTTHLSWIENQIRQHDASFRWTKDETAMDGSSRPDITFACEGCCRLPSPPKYGKYTSSQCSSTPGSLVPSGCQLKYSCRGDYTLNQDSEYSVCQNGVWNNDLDCIKLCPPLVQLDVSYSCYYNGKEASCELPMKPDTFVTANCTQYYRPTMISKDFNMVCLSSGEWSKSLPYCAPECGWPSKVVAPIIVYSRHYTRLGQFPWLAVIYQKTADNKWDFRCGGTLVSPRHVFTAAHCFVNDNVSLRTSDIRVGLGKFFKDFNTTESTSLISEVREVAISRQYSGSSSFHANDIAFVYLVASVQVTAYIMPACIDWSIVMNLSDEGVVARWENSEHYKGGDYVLKTRLEYITHSQCLENIKPAFKSYLTDDKLCAGNINGSQFNHIDGSGLTFTDPKGQHYIIGIASSRIPEETSFALFTDIRRHITWIDGLYDRFDNTSSSVVYI